MPVAPRSVNDVLFFSIGQHVLIGLCFFIGWKLPPPACPGTTGTKPFLKIPHMNPISWNYQVILRDDIFHTPLKNPYV